MTNTAQISSLALEVAEWLTETADKEILLDVVNNDDRTQRRYQQAAQRQVEVNYYRKEEGNLTADGVIAGALYRGLGTEDETERREALVEVAGLALSLISKIDGEIAPAPTPTPTPPAAKKAAAPQPNGKPQLEVIDGGKAGS